ncbi:MAG: undecaprenyldiphospho-muramoylpentapeptide beta-N-acetylglucosaminyltransferase [Clostridia bacterium]|nr:undecaprenyldiphospho-muramoylpentapeptide beta-N-acetylglucosaminyltransferase [Clostridia bacterium]
MRILLAGGGTAGHINPALSIADQVRLHDPDAEVLFVGKRGNMEEKLVTKRGYAIDFIEIEGFKRSPLKNIRVVFKTLKAIAQSKKIIKKFRPDVVVTTGGYVSGPVMVAAHQSGVPSLIHESNVYPGVAVKMAARTATRIAVSFDKTRELIAQKEKCIKTGNPVRAEILETTREQARKALRIKDKPLVLVFGGSLGAQKLNEAVLGYIENIQNAENVQLIFGTGERNYAEVMGALSEKQINVPECEHIKVLPYIYNMNEAMAAADVVISRAGAITLAELMALGKPSVLIPSPNVAYNHQETNARQLEKNGAALVLTEAELTAKTLQEKIDLLLSDANRLYTIGENAKKMGVRDATERIYEIIEEIRLK